MASPGEAAAAKPEGLDLMGHLLDSDRMTVPLVNAPHGLDGHLTLPKLPVFKVLGIPVDLSITRDVVILWVAAAACLVLLLVAFRRPRLVPSRMGNLLEPVVLYVRDQVVLATMGERGRPYVPYLLTVFFFILTCNLLGLVPYSVAVTSNISVTAALALCTFAIMVGVGIFRNGLMGFVRSLVPHGVPVWLAPVMLIVEALSLIIRPVALCIRLFANMVAGHAVILSLIGMVFVLQSVTVGFLIIPFTVFLYVLEILVAFVQAFVFTLLSSVFIGMAVYPEH